MTVQRAEVAIEKAALDRKITLDPAARRTLALELIRQEAARPNPAAAPESHAADVVAPVAARAGASSTISADAARTAVADAKTEQLTRTMDKTIEMHAQATKRTIDPKTRELMKADLQKQIEGLSRSGLPADAIEQRNQMFLQAVEARLTEPGPMTPAQYQMQRDFLFSQFVDVAIDSVPTGAALKLDGFDIGTTSITKALQPGTEHRLSFSMNGFDTATRTVYISPAVAQKVLETLAPAATPTPGAENSAGGEGSSSTWLIILIVVGVVGIVIFLVRMGR